MAKRDAFFDDLNETQRRMSVAKKLYLSNRPSQWSGPVERRDPAKVRRKSESLARCRNPYCRAFPPQGSRDAGYCLLCETPL